MIKIRLTILLCLSILFQFSFSQVVLNEVMHYPSTAQGIVSTGTEYVELFNTSPCQVANIGCFMIGFADDDGSIVNNRGSIVLPSGTTIPPLGHFVIGTSTSSANAASVDFKTNLNTSNYCAVGNCVLANGDGWVALYDPNGQPVDAIYWTVNAGESSKITTDTDLDDNPCVLNNVAGCTNSISSLPSAKQIFQTFPTRINYIGQYVNANTISRIPDGGTWTRAVAPSINDATVGNCNGGTCLTPTAIVFTISKTNPSCGSSNGSITLNVTSSGTASYTWSANANTGNSSTASNLNGSTYNVTITQNGCTKDTSITLSSSGLPIFTTAITNATCGNKNGSISLNVTSSGTASYTWSANANTGNTNTANNLGAGAYIVSVTQNGCTKDTTLNLTSTSLPVFTVTKTNPTCGNNNGSISLNITSSGTASYTWSANANTGNSNTANNLGAGTYIVSVTQNGCTKDTNITLNSNSSLSITFTNPVNPTCAGKNGAVTVNLSGGSAPYSVTIDTGGTPFTINLPVAISQTLNNLSAGTVQISVTDASTCQASNSTTLTAPSNCCTFKITANLSQPSCGTQNGNISIAASNGSGNYSYTWSANAVTGNLATANNLGASQYNLTVTDNGFANCFIDTIFTLVNPNSPSINGVTKVNETCTGTSDGSANINASGGNGTLSYTWSANANTGNVSAANNLTAGTYFFTVSDQNNCQTTGNVTIQSGICCTLKSNASVTSTTCGLDNGSITVNIQVAGTSPYLYSINGTAPQSTNTFGSLAAGSYEIITTDKNGCKDTITSTIGTSVNTLNISLSKTDASCFGYSDGKASANVTGGNPNYSYNWSNGNQNSSLQNLITGNYFLTVTDKDNCTISSTIKINEPLPLGINLGNDTTVCDGNSVFIDAGSGYTKYEWNNSESTQTISTKQSGLYTITVTDNNGCTASDNLKVTASQSATLDLGEDISIYSGESATLSPVITGGASGNGSYNWSPPNFLSCTNCKNPTASPTTNSQFVLIYSDALGCISTDSINILVLDPGKVYFPSAFTPNGDGKNDIFRALGNGAKQYRLKIFNRWGELVFETADFNEGWDGTYKGSAQPVSVFVYLATVTFQNNKTNSYNGSITLIR
jgi:gliding motility-associated-like protein